MSTPFKMKGFSGFGNSPLKSGSEMQFDAPHGSESYKPSHMYLKGKRTLEEDKKIWRKSLVRSAKKNKL
jgi:hypothetical protein